VWNKTDHALLFPVGGLTELGGSFPSKDEPRDIVTTGVMEVRLYVKNFVGPNTEKSSSKRGRQTSDIVENVLEQRTGFFFCDSVHRRKYKALCDMWDAFEFMDTIGLRVRILKEIVAPLDTK
jgi:hypothetical protein